MSLCIDLPNRRATRQLARQLAPHLEGHDLLVLSGALGAGKTFLTRALAGELGVDPRRVTSPTFALVHELAGRMPIAHADLYRLRSEDELRHIGLDGLRDAGHLLIVEWGEPYAAFLGGDALLVRFSLEPRRAEISATGPRSEAILSALARTLDGAPAPR